MQIIEESTFRKRMFYMSGCFLIFLQASATPLRVKIRLFATDNVPST